MNRIALSVACGAFVVAVGAGAGCGGGTLGTPGVGGNTGSINTGSAVDGFAGATPPGVGTGGVIGVAGSPGVGGDGVSPPPGGPGGVVGAAAGRGGGGVGGSAGVMGRAGFGGSTGRGGASGSGFILCPPPGPPVCGALCGNGLIDSCNTAIAPQCLPILESEDCDGWEFGANTCATRGYGSGNLTCTSTCTIDDRSCSYCAPIGGPMISCGPAPIAFLNVGSFSLAASDREVGLTQIDYGVNTDSSRLTFARLDAALGVINVAGLDDTISPGPLQGLSIDSAVGASIGAGWLVAACATGRLVLYAVDANGKKVGRTMLSDGTDDRDQCSAGTVSLAPAPNGTALLMYQTWYGDFRAVVIGNDGSPQGTSAPITDPAALLVGLPTAAWTGDAFTIVVPFETPGDYTTVVHLLRLTSDGTLSTIGDILRDEFVYAPVVVTGASDIRLVYMGTPPGGSQFDRPTVLWREVGAMGELLSGAVSLGATPRYVSTLRAVAFGADTVTLLNGAYQEQLSIARLDATLALSNLDVAKTPIDDLQVYDMVRRGPDVIVGWLTGAGLTLARLTP